MKTHTTLTIDADLLKEAKEAGAILSDILREGLMKALRKPNPKIEPDIKDYSCCWCKKMIIDDFYFYCVFHKNVFCDRCAKNEYEKVWRVVHKGRAPYCVNNDPHIDCILERKEIKTRYIEEVKEEQ